MKRFRVFEEDDKNKKPDIKVDAQGYGSMLVGMGQHSEKKRKKPKPKPTNEEASSPASKHDPLSPDLMKGQDYHYPELTRMDEKLSNHYHNGISAGETRLHVRSYSSSSKETNNELINRHNYGAPVQGYRAYHAHMLNKHLHSQSSPEDMTVYSGTSHSPEHHELRPDGNRHVVLPAFTSTSISPRQAGMFAKQDTTDPNHKYRGHHMLRIHVPAGSKGAYIASQSEMPEEKEFLLPTGSRLHIHPDPQTIDHAHPHSGKIRQIHVWDATLQPHHEGPEPYEHNEDHRKRWHKQEGYNYEPSNPTTGFRAKQPNLYATHKLAVIMKDAGFEHKKVQIAGTSVGKVKYKALLGHKVKPSGGDPLLQTSSKVAVVGKGMVDKTSHLLQSLKDLKIPGSKPGTEKYYQHTANVSLKGSTAVTKSSGKKKFGQLALNNWVSNHPAWNKKPPIKVHP